MGDGGCAFRAGLASPAVDGEVQLEEPRLAVGVAVVADRRAAPADRLGQPVAHRGPEPPAAGRAQRGRDRPRVDAGGKQGLVAVDVAHARQHGLVSSHSPAMVRYFSTMLVSSRLLLWPWMRGP